MVSDLFTLAIEKWSFYEVPLASIEEAVALRHLFVNDATPTELFLVHLSSIIRLQGRYAALFRTFNAGGVLPP